MGYIKYMQVRHQAEAHSEPIQTLKMELFLKIVNPLSTTVALI